MLVTTSDPSRYLKQFFRIGRDNRKSFLFTNPDGSEKNLDGYTITVRFKESKDDEDDDAVLELTIGDGLTVTGGLVEQAIPEASSDFSEADYYMEWEIVQGGWKRNWFSGVSLWHNGAYDGVPDFLVDEPLEINENGSIMVTIVETGSSQESSFMSIRSNDFDASSGEFPSSGGRHTGGLPKKFDVWIVAVAGTLAGVEVAAGAMIMANANGPGAAWGTTSGWSLLRA